MAHRVFDKHFGRQRDNRDICVFVFEPNPAHAERHLKVAAAYKSMGWRYHPILAGIGNEDGSLTFYHNNDEGKQEWGFGITQLKGDKSTPVEVPILKFSSWLEREIYNRKTPGRVYGTYYRENPRVVMKMDIEGMEYAVLPDLMFSGVLCKTVDYLFGEFHKWTPVDFSTDRGSLKLTPRQETTAFASHLRDAFHAVPSDSCKTSSTTRATCTMECHCRMVKTKL